MRDEGSGFGSSQILEKMLNRKNFMPSFQQAPLYESLLTFSPAGSCGKLGARGLLLPTKGRVDQFLYLQTPFRSASETFLRKPVRVLDRTTIERVLYIHQGELGYAIPSQCDVILSDKATTCHILSIQSTSSHALVPTLTSFSHIDGPLYTECLQEMIETHVRHHNGNERQNQGLAHKVDLLIDVVGGFDDNQGASSEISSWLFQALAYFADEFHDVLTMTIRTCAISCMNGAGDFSPIGRGMGVDLRTGEAFLAKADSSVAGPASQLRSSRIWADGGEGRLAVVHTSTSNNFAIHPFEFRATDGLRA
jgi:protein N-terminal asparagine amidohydrolase